MAIPNHDPPVSPNLDSVGQSLHKETIYVRSHFTKNSMSWTALLQSRGRSLAAAPGLFLLPLRKMSSCSYIENVVLSYRTQSKWPEEAEIYPLSHILFSRLGSCPGENSLFFFHHPCHCYHPPLHLSLLDNGFRTCLADLCVTTLKCILHRDQPCDIKN